MVKRLCRHVSCDAYALDGQTRCEEHIADKRRHDALLSRKFHERPEVKAWRKLYDTTQWRRERLVFLARSPLCLHCHEVGLVVAATEVDHITPHRGNKALFYDRRNWQGLCRPCHSRKTAGETLHKAV